MSGIIALLPPKPLFSRHNTYVDLIKSILSQCARHFLCLASFASADEIRSESANQQLEILPTLVLETDLPDNHSYSRFNRSSSVLSIPRERIEQAGVNSVADLLSFEAGLAIPSFFGNSATGSPIMRGFAENASTRTLILVDGVPLSRPDLGAPTWTRLPLDSLERIDLAPGSRTVRYGSAALAGVISLETRRPTGKTQANIEAAIGSNNLRRLRSAAYIPLSSNSGANPSERWQLGFISDAHRTDGWRDHSGLRSNAWQLILDGSKEYGLTHRWTINYDQLDLENPGGLNNQRYRQNPRQSIYRIFGVDKDFRNHFSNLLIANQIVAPFDDSITLSINSSFQSRQREQNFGAGSHTDNELTTWFSEPLVKMDFAPLSFETGIRFQHDDLLLTRYLDSARRSPFANAEITRSSLAAFLIGSWQVSPRWTLTSGAGWETNTLNIDARDQLSANNPLANFTGSRAENGYSFESSLLFQANPNWQIWGRYDRIYRFPVVDEVAAFQGFLLTRPFNPDLQAERGHNFELGTRYQQGNWDFALTSFLQQLNGEIAFDFQANENTNFANTQRLGIETQLGWQNEHLRLRLNHYWLSAQFQSGPFRNSEVPLVPNQTASLTAIYTPNPKWSVGLETQYVGASFEGNDFLNNQARLPSRLLHNAFLRHRIHENCELFARVDNLLDRRHATLKFQGLWYPGAGRQASLGLRFNF